MVDGAVGSVLSFFFLVGICVGICVRTGTGTPPLLGDGTGVVSRVGKEVGVIVTLSVGANVSSTCGTVVGANVLVMVVVKVGAIVGGLEVNPGVGFKVTTTAIVGGGDDTTAVVGDGDSTGCDTGDWLTGRSVTSNGASVGGGDSSTGGNVAGATVVEKTDGGLVSTSVGVGAVGSRTALIVYRS